MTLSEFDAAAEAALASGDATALERLLRQAERNAARAIIRCGDHKRYRGRSAPRQECETCCRIREMEVGR